MTQLRLSAESSLGKILDKNQVGRLKQIQLQLDRGRGSSCEKT